MKVVLKRDTIVRHKAGEVVEVSEEEAKRLLAYNLAEVKKTTKK